VKYQLTDEAAKDVEGILTYSVNNFGLAQTEHYFEELKECIELLFPYESHVIFYKRLSSSILVVRILHERMDPKLHIK